MDAGNKPWFYVRAVNVLSHSAFSSALNPFLIYLSSPDFFSLLRKKKIMCNMILRI